MVKCHSNASSGCQHWKKFGSCACFADQNIPFVLARNSIREYRVPTHPAETWKMKETFPSLEKSWKKEKLKQSWKNPRNFLKLYMKLGLSIFGKMSIPQMKQLLPQTTVLENLNFDLEKSWKNACEKLWEP